MTTLAALNKNVRTNRARVGVAMHAINLSEVTLRPNGSQCITSTSYFGGTSPP
ncbi:MAG: hypothetical protein ACRD4D_00990 [Candidatus Acidiferrales bacterium]